MNAVSTKEQEGMEGLEDRCNANGKLGQVYAKPQGHGRTHDIDLLKKTATSRLGVNKRRVQFLC